MKSYTDLNQSKKLAEILPLESADMCFNISQRSNMPPLMTPYSKFNEFFNIGETPDFLIPCWSLASLLCILQNYQLQTQDDGIGILCSRNGTINIATSDNSVDACYEMIIKLNELKVL